ncbi:hypothetical protein BJ508DRAFT_335644 [Ascobolus immersus RN42]|uniref:Beta/gamma crystallin 'Greek key' domain-containing protein n=1 Tax=Ascobolus immersus RN42 TaxID=1160509 RepID=A0A3N4HIM0_ASCIM|nr:hypothetical protein BJ508DRAFT_335644 [Ascobolus immersus RN42]
MKLTLTALLAAISLASATAIPAPAPARVAISSAAPAEATPANARIALTAPIAELSPIDVVAFEAYVAASESAAGPAAPESHTDKRDLSKRQSRDMVWVCRDAPWVYATCKQVNGVPDGRCVNLGYPWSDSISSVGPNSGLFCQFFVDSNCSGDNFGAQQPGFEDLSYGSGFWNDKISSLRCWYA